MASDPVPDGNGWAPVTLLQAYPENDPEGPCDNKRGDLIYGHFPLDAFGAATHWIERSGELDKMLVDGGFTNQGGGSGKRKRMLAVGAATVACHRAACLSINHESPPRQSLPTPPHVTL
jgi:hypothetical protein